MSIIQRYPLAKVAFKWDSLGHKMDIYSIEL